MTELAVIAQHITDADALVVKRISDDGILISDRADKVIGTSFRSSSFNEAITGLVIPGLNPAEIARVELKHVEAPIEFTTVRGDQYFNIAPYSKDNTLLGGRGTLKKKHEVAQLLTAKLALS